jgi:hypothetical protein
LAGTSLRFPESALAFRYIEKQRKQVIMKMNFFIIKLLIVTMTETVYYSPENDVFLHFEFKKISTFSFILYQYNSLPGKPE